MDKRYLTAVFEIDGGSDKQPIETEIFKLFDLTETTPNDPVRVVSVSRKDEATKLDLIEFGLEVDDLDFVREVLDDRGLEQKLTLFRKVNDYANENSVSFEYAYEKVA